MAQKVAEETKGEIVPLLGDVTQASTTADLVIETVKAFGGLDLLVTNSVELPWLILQKRLP